MPWLRLTQYILTFQIFSLIYMLYTTSIIELESLQKHPKKVVWTYIRVAGDYQPNQNSLVWHIWLQTFRIALWQAVPLVQDMVLALSYALIRSLGQWRWRNMWIHHFIWVVSKQSFKVDWVFESFFLQQEDFHKSFHMKTLIFLAIKVSKPSSTSSLFSTWILFLGVTNYTIEVIHQRPRKWDERAADYDNDGVGASFKWRNFLLNEVSQKLQPGK